MNNFLATVKDDGLTIVLGGILGPSALGFLGTAQRASQYPLRFFMDNVTKVTFPAFSRMQDEKEQLARVVGRSVFFICALVFPTLIGLVVLFPNILQIIPKYQKWEPAYIPLIFFSANSLIGAFTTQFTNTLNAIGKIRTTFKLMVMWTSLSWLLIPYLAVKGNVIGASLGYFLVSVTSVVAYFILKRLVNFNAFYSIGKPFISSVLMLLVLIISKRFIEGNNLVSFLALVFLGGITYLLTLYLLTGKVFLEDVKKTYTSIINR